VKEAKQSKGKEAEYNTYKFRHFTPSNKITIPSKILESLEGKERELFRNTSSIDIKIVLELNDGGQINTIENAELYLFFPLQITSGFRFIIHSYFIVNPERTALRESALNTFLLRAIGEFIGTEMLKALKKNKNNTTAIFCFQRNKDAKLEVLYDTVVHQLRNQKFIYDNQSRSYFSPSDVIVADGFDKGLFPEGKLGNKRLIYADDDKTRDWLRNESGLQYLSYEQIADEIENECKRQLKNRKVKFFQNLYNYVSRHERLNLTGRKVLLTDRWTLVSSEDDVFYRGGGMIKRTINLPPSIQKHIHFINREIKITDFREGKSRTGIKEYNTFELVRRLLKLFSNEAVPKADVLNAIFDLELARYKRPFKSSSNGYLREIFFLQCCTCLQAMCSSRPGCCPIA
jgi:hypothetical protein